LLMAIPAENFTIGIGVVVRVPIFVVGFPCSLSFPASVCRYQSVGASAGVPVCCPCALTSSTSPLVCLYDDYIRKCHVSPPALNIVYTAFINFRRGSYYEINRDLLEHLTL